MNSNHRIFTNISFFEKAYQKFISQKITPNATKQYTELHAHFF